MFYDMHICKNCSCVIPGNRDIPFCSKSCAREGYNRKIKIHMD